jgi:hypothetical protein
MLNSKHPVHLNVFVRCLVLLIVKRKDNMWDFKFSRRRVWCSELSSGLYCRTHPWWWRQYAPLKRRSTIILHGSTTQKTALNERILFRDKIIRDVFAVLCHLFGNSAHAHGLPQISLTSHTFSKWQTFIIDRPINHREETLRVPTVTVVKTLRN